MILRVLLTCLFSSAVSAATIENTRHDITPPCTIPNQEPKYGVCTPVSSCVAYQSLRQQNRLDVSNISFLRQIQCDRSPGQVCCPDQTSSHYQNASVTIDVGKLKVRSTLPPAKSSVSELANRFGDDRTTTADEVAAKHDLGLIDGNDEECGQYVDQRIIGGEIAGLDDYPWTALLIYNSTFKYGCSGSVINKRFVLTAAHCVTGMRVARKGNLIRVRLGEYDTQGDPDCIQEEDGYECADQAQEYDIEKTIVHPYYDEASDSQHHDIALIKTAKTIQYSIYILPLCIPTKNLSAGVVPGKRMSLAGWGATDRFQSRLGNILSPIKLFTEVPIVNQTVCQAKFSNSRLVLSSSQLCAGGEKDNDSCPGDSGGPLMYFNHDANRFVCAGIVSLGKDEKGKIACGEEGFPGVYTRTDQYSEWILNAMHHN